MSANFSGPLIPPNRRAHEEILRQWYEAQIMSAHSARAVARITEQMAAQERGGICVAVGTVSERDEALPIRAVKGGFLSDAVEQINRIPTQTIEQAIEEANKDVSQIIAETDVLQGIVGKGHARAADDRCAATGTVSDRLKSRGHRQHQLVTPPGSWMLKVAGVVFSPKVYERVFEQAVADFREEYFAAISRRVGWWQLFFVVARHWCGFVLAFIYEVFHGVAKLWRSLKGAG